MFVIGYAPRSESYCGVHKLFVLQDVKRWAIRHLCFSFAPLPKCAEHCRGTPAKRASSANAPKFILVADTRDSCLLNRALTRLPQPIPALEPIQLGFQFYGKC